MNENPKRAGIIRLTNVRCSFPTIGDRRWFPIEQGAKPRNTIDWTKIGAYRPDLSHRQPQP